ncbi:hypothetical protein ACFVH6_22030 [Spirillospora sp. NPDC127200]
MINGRAHTDPTDRPIQFAQVTPGQGRVHAAAASAINWATLTLVMAAAPCIVWLWRWAV